MRGLRILLAAAALLSFAVTARAQEAVSYYGFSFPLKIGMLTRGDVTDFEKTSAGAGYGIRYTADGIRADVFVYDLGKRSISWDIFHTDQKEEFETSIRAVHRAKERGLYRDVKEGREFETPAVKNPFFRCKVLVIDRGDGRAEDSVLCLGAQNDKFFKTRIAFVPSGGANVVERADKLLREIARAAKF
jgi:hypothetical protein